MKLDPKAFGLAAGAVAAVLFILCVIGVATVPGFTTAVGGLLLHVDLSGITRSLSWGNFIGGLIGWGVGSALVCWLVAALYNRFGGAHA